jgi:23S rRNA (uracil1939-C5)-methyltransferase
MAPRRDAEVHELEIERLDSEARGVGRTPEGRVVFVTDALPGQRVRVRLGRGRKKWAEGRLLDVLRESPHRVEPPCVHFWSCGGCRLQHLDYPQQLEAKTAQVREALVHLGLQTDPPVAACEPSPRRWGYRNKMEYSFGEQRWLEAGELGAADRTGLGLHPRGRWDRVIHLRECRLPEPRSVELLHRVQGAVERSRRPAYSTKTHSGYWRFLVVRQGVRTGQWLVDVITAPSREGHGEVEALARSLAADFPDLTTLTHTLSSSPAAVATGEEHRVLFGPGWIEEEVGGLRFRLSPRSFFQTNTEAAERLYGMAAEAAGLSGRERVWDVYCGTGTIALLLAGLAAEVVGFESEPTAVADARENAERNGIGNVRFVERDAAALPVSGISEEPPDVVVVDPPRAGLHPDARTGLLELSPPRIVYISCNPATLARDVQEFITGGYRLDSVRPIDLFPHTAHVESVTCLTRV